MTANPNLNNVRSETMRRRLIAATVELLIEVGYPNTTGVAVCRRAGVTRGALNHHFPDFADLLIATLQQIYNAMTDTGTPEDAAMGPLERMVATNYQRVIQPEFKAVIELWLASRNDPEVRAALSQAILEASELFSPQARLSNRQDGHPAGSGFPIQGEVAAVYHTLMESLIGIGLGRATNGGSRSAHENQVLQTLTQIARQQDSAGGSHEQTSR